MSDAESRCRDLWAAVLVQAFQDALWQDPVPTPITASRADGKRREAMAAGVRARRWFERGGDDFRLVCEWAGLDPSYVREKFRKALKGYAIRTVEVE